MPPGDKLVFHNVIPGATSKKLCKLLWMKQNGILKNVKVTYRKTGKRQKKNKKTETTNRKKMAN